MANKENKGGILKNDQVEQDLKAKGVKSDKGESYIGSQDTGDSEVRQRGNEIQRADGAPKERGSGEG